MDMEPINCGPGGGADSMLHLRIAAIFIILIGSSSGALFPVLAKRSSWLHVPKSVFEYVSCLRRNLFFSIIYHFLASQNTLAQASLQVFFLPRP